MSRNKPSSAPRVKKKTRTDGIFLGQTSLPGENDFSSPSIQRPRITQPTPASARAFFTPKIFTPKKRSLFPSQELSEELHQLSLYRNAHIKSIGSSRQENTALIHNENRAPGFDTVVGTNNRHGVSSEQDYSGSRSLITFNRSAARKDRARTLSPKEHPNDRDKVNIRRKKTITSLSGHPPIYIENDSSDSDRKSIIYLSSDESEPESSGRADTENTENQLADILDKLSNHIRPIYQMRRLPFLRRTLRRAMDSLGRYSINEYISHPMKTHYKWGGVQLTGSDLFGGCWWCPICQILNFDTQQGLFLHISKIHGNCEYTVVKCSMNYDYLEVIVPDAPESDSEEDMNSKDSGEDEEFDTSDTDISSVEIHSISDSPSLEEIEPLLRDMSVYNEKRFLDSHRVKLRESPEMEPNMSIQQAMNIVKRPPRPIDPENPDRYPTPPPYDNLEGPSAVYPYISPQTYSARPGGPKLYDLLNELPLDQFGIMEWLIIDWEEDLFELDNVRDEDKMMRALWNRWIFLHRNKFIENYGNGIKMFIDEYWRMIHRGAGYGALQVWLLVLVKNKFLTGSQYCEALRYYTNLVGMDHWHPKKDLS